MKLKSVILKHKDEFLELAKKLSFKHQVTDEKKMLVDEKKRLEDSITKIDRYKKAYEEKIDGMLPESVYQPMINIYSAERNDILGRIKAINEKIEEQDEENPNYYEDSEKELI